MLCPDRGERLLFAVLENAVDELPGHQGAPFTDPALQCAELAIGELSWPNSLQSLEQRLRIDIGRLL